MILKSAMKKIENNLSKEKIQKYDEYFDYSQHTFTLRNTRKINIIKMLPKNSKSDIFYKYQFLGHAGNNDHLSLEEMAEQLLKIGYANYDIAGLTAQQLTEIGFVAENGTNIVAVSEMLRPDNYKLELTENKYYGPEYEEGHDNQPYFGATYQDIYQTENLSIYGKIIAHRDLAIGSVCVNDYVGG